MTQVDTGDRDLVRELLEAVEGLKGADVELLVPGVTDNDLSRWKSGAWKRLSGPKRNAIKAFLALRYQNPQRSLDHLVSAAAKRRAESEVLDLFGDFETVVRHIKRVGEPGEATNRKLDGIQAALQTATAWNIPVPNWFYEVRRMIEDGEL